MTAVSAESSERALNDATRGRFVAVDALLAGLSRAMSPAEEAWASALRAARYRAGLEAQRPLLPRSEDAPLLPEAIHALGYSCAELARSAALLFDHGAMHTVMSVYGRLQEEGADPLRHAITRGFVEALSGDASEQLAARLRSLGSEAAERDLPYLVVETTALRALVMLNGDDLPEATTLARRASRMARTEAMPQAEYLANVILARVRRLGGRPHLATRILRGLAKVAPPVWHPWLRWEMTMAAGRRGADGLGEATSQEGPAPMSAGPAAGPGRGLVAVLDAARRGDIEGFDAAVSALDGMVRPFAPLAFDAANALTVIDPRGETSRALGEVTRWREGHLAALPLGLSGLAGRDTVDGSLAVVSLGPGERARRALHVGGALFAGPAVAERGTEGHGRPGRTETALSVLAFAGDGGLEEGALFRGAYGFEYARDLHRGVLGVLVHRARTRASGFAELEREGGRVMLRPLASMVLPDPRCAQPMEDRVLKFVARTGQSTAKDTSKALGISLRSAQAALQALVEDGTCDRAREGRRIRYLVEDTTFREPTGAA